MLRAMNEVEKREVREMIQIVRESAEVVTTLAGRQAMAEAIDEMEHFLRSGMVEIDEEEQGGE